MSNKKSNAVQVEEQAIDPIREELVSKFGKLLFIAGAESQATLLERPLTKRSGEPQEDFDNRKARNELYRAIAESISTADRELVFEQLVRYAQYDPAPAGASEFEQRIAREQHLINLTLILQRIMRSATNEALFTEQRLDAKLRKYGTEADHREGSNESPDEERANVYDLGEMLGGVSVPEDRAEDEAELPARELLIRAPSDGLIIEALEALYKKLLHFTATIQQEVRTSNFEPRMLSMYSVARDEDSGQVWNDTYTVDESRMAWHEAKAKRAEALQAQRRSTLSGLNTIFG